MTDLEIISESERVYNKAWSHNFHWKDGHGSGYSFECDETGFLEPMMQAGWDSWDLCQDNPDLVDDGVQMREWSYFRYAIGKCQCGREVHLQDPLWNGCDCGLYYNMSGQEVRSPEQYMREDYLESGESVSDMYSEYDPEEI